MANKINIEIIANTIDNVVNQFKNIQEIVNNIASKWSGVSGTGLGVNNPSDEEILKRKADYIQKNQQTLDKYKQHL